MRSNDGVAMYDPERRQYDIILNNSEDVLQARMLWTAVHEIGHIYLGHLDDSRTRISA
jgi:predicted Zn-dependent protease